MKECKKLIEVALPIREISAESVRDKNIHHAHISHLHIWWARRPLPASRAVVFASLIPDPDDPKCPDNFKQAVERLLKIHIPSQLRYYTRKRDVFQDNDPYKPYSGISDTLHNRLLMFIAKWSPESISFEEGKRGTKPSPKMLLDDRSLVKWETCDPRNLQGVEVLRIARELVRIANNGKVPTVLDSFAGGGAIPLEAGRPGCQPIANDYNPVAYMILRSSCEFPQKYGKPVVAYLWARTAPCSNPSCRGEIPLLSSLLICIKTRKRTALTMKVDKERKEICFNITKCKKGNENERNNAKSRQRLMSFL